MTAPPPADPHPPAALFDTRLLRQRRSRAAARFAGFNFLKHRTAEALAERLLDSNRRFALGLDIGCHHGELNAALMATGRIGRLIQCDSSLAMAAQAPAPAVVMDEEHLAVGDSRVDFIASTLALHRVNDLPGALIQIRRALVPDGLFLGALFGGDTLTELRTAFTEAEAEIDGGASPRVAPFADLRTVAGLMQRAGFALPVVDTDRQDVTYPTPLALLADLRGMGETNALTARRKRPLRRGVVMRMAEIYAQRFAAPGGRVRATFEIMYLAGWHPHASQQQPLKPGSAAQKLADALNTDEIGTGDKAGY